MFLILMTVLAAGQLASKQAPKHASPKSPAATAAPPAAAPFVFKISSQDKAKKNPVPFTDASVAGGKKLYATECALCHGANGDGKGSLASVLKVKLLDMTKPGALANRTDGELFAIISQGSPTMPKEEGRLSTTQRWEIVDFLHSLGGKTPPKATEREKLQLERTIVINH